MDTIVCNTYYLQNVQLLCNVLIEKLVKAHAEWLQPRTYTFDTGTNRVVDYWELALNKLLEGQGTSTLG